MERGLYVCHEDPTVVGHGGSQVVFNELMAMTRLEQIDLIDVYCGCQSPSDIHKLAAMGMDTTKLNIIPIPKEILHSQNVFACDNWLVKQIFG